MENDDTSQAQSLAGQLKVLYAWQDDIIPESDEQCLCEQTATVEPKDTQTNHKTEAEIRAWLVSQLSEMLHIAPQELNVSEPFTRYGLDSADAVRAMGKVEVWVGRSLSPTLFWDYPNVEALARHLAGEPSVEPHPTVDTAPRSEREPIAIIGMGCRFPGAQNPEEFWHLVHDGIDAIGDVPEWRWDVNAFYDPIPSTPGKIYTRTGGFLDQVDRFDPSFFGISAGEATTMDPQQRLMLEVTWEALESTGRAPDRLAGSRTGVFIGISNVDYSAILLSDAAHMNVYAGTGGAHCITANRLSYLFDFHGPSLIVDTACSSALVAIHLACQSLRSGECETAVAGGVNLVLSPEPTVAYCQAQMMSVGGRCKAFDAEADGYARGEGCGVVILKRLSAAIADGDQILALVRGSAVNQDGRTNGMTAPNGLSQQAVIREALANAGVSPSQISYVEAHGTGTPLGDPIEAQALAAVLGREPAGYPCYFASVKTNIGHLEPASGIAGVIKVVLAFQHGEIPPHLHLKKLNPLISLEGTRLVIPTERCPWPVEARPRIAGVSAFGFGGTNGHVVLEEAPVYPIMRTQVERPLHLFTLSARSESALKESARRFADRLPALPDDSIADVCFTANVGRSHFSHRLAVTVESTASLREQLDAFVIGKETSRLMSSQVRGKQRPSIAFLFTGQGSQYVGMAKQLYETQPAFRSALQCCDELLRPYLEEPLLSVLYPADGQASPLDETAYTQPALFALEYALAELWRSWGVEPQAMFGHSVGEYVAACLAGVFSLEDALKLIAWRGRLMQELPRDGAMAVVFASAERVAAAIVPYSTQVSIAALNGPNNVVISGERAALQAVQQNLAAEGIVTRPLVVSHAFHSPLMEPMLDKFEQLAGQVQFQAPRIPVVSNVTGQIMESGYIPDARYWRGHIRSAVQFEKGMKTLVEQGYHALVELGPSPVLCGMGKRCVPGGESTWLASLEKGKDEWRTLLGSLGGLYLQGVPIDWSGFDRDYVRRRISLPTYPFERQRYWFDPDKGARRGINAAGQPVHPLLGWRLRSALKEIQFESELIAEAVPYLNDHRVCGQTVFPATGYLEMARAAAANAWTSGINALENLCLEEPLILAGEASLVQLILTPDGSGGGTFQILSQESDGEVWRTHVSGSINNQEVTTQGPRQEISLGAAQARCTDELPRDSHYERLWKLGLEYGPDFRGVEKLWRGKGEALGLVRLPNGLEVGAYAIHPALLDACLQVSAVAFAGDQENDVYLPMGVESFRVWAKPGECVWSYVVLQSGDEANRDTPKGDVHIFDQAGQLVAQLIGLSARRTSRDVLQRVGRDRISDWLYTVRWQPKTHATTTSQPIEEQNGRWLIFADHNGVGATLAKQISECGAQCMLVYPGKKYQVVANDCFIDPAQPEDFERVLAQDVTPFRGIIHLWSLDAAPTEQATSASLELDEARICGSVLNLVQTLARTERSDSSAVYLVTRGAQPAASEAAPLAIAQAPLVGLARVIALEHPELHCVQVDLDPANCTDEIEMLLGEICAQPDEPEIAFRQGTRYVPRLARATVNGEPGGPRLDGFRSEATYLITGGRGGLGLQVAQWMVAQGARHLVLVGRSEPTEAVHQAVGELEQSGAHILFARADVSQAEQVARVLAEIAQSMPPLRGVVHAAGVLDDGVLTRQDWGRFARVLAPKVQGAWNLHALTLSMPLDFFILFSSTASVLGSPGQGNYAAANAFLDGLAHYRCARGLPGLSINWGVWGEVGMAARQVVRERMTLLGIETIAPQQGVHALEQVLRRSIAQIAVAPIDWRRLLEQFPPGSEPPLLSELFGEVRARQKDQRTSPVQIEILSRLEQAPLSNRRRVLVTLMCEQARRVLGLETDFELDVRQPLNELGLNSLMALELRNTLNLSLGRSLPATVLFEHPTIESLSGYLADEILHLPVPEGTRASMTLADRQVEEQDQLEAEIKKLSADELEALVAEELAAIKPLVGE